jgi:phosphate starvation-inducible membrane PsiE
MKKKIIVKTLKFSSIFCALIGGILLASNIPTSGYGFIFLALSSGQLLLASLHDKDTSTILYAASVFVFVDCLWVYRWLLN